LIQQARRSLERNINTTITTTYYKISWRIIEKEQQDEKRAQIWPTYTTGVVYKIPCTELEKCKGHDDLSQSGVYF